jgi:hypothetical protein
MQRLDYAAAERQAFGYAFSQQDVDRLLNGSLQIHPHPAWPLPSDIDWRADPFNDNNWRHQYQMLRWLDPLRRAAHRGNDEAFKLWLRYVRDWVTHNPSDNPISQYAWRDMVDGIRAVQLCLAAPLLRERSEEDLVWLGASIRDHAAWLSDSGNLGHSNHALHQHQGLLVCGLVLGDETLVRLATERHVELFESQYDSEGINAEGAIAYHYNNYVWWKNAWRRFEAAGIALPDSAAVLEMVPEELAHATRPTGDFVSIGDTDGGSPRKVSHPFTRYVTTNGSDGEPPRDLLKIYEAGLLFARSGWGENERDFEDETYFSVSFGRNDRIHGHPDGGSLTYTAQGVDWLVDPGKYAYSTDPFRKFLLSRNAHNLVTVEDEPASSAGTVELVENRVTPSSYGFTFTDSTHEHVQLTRRLCYSTTGEYLVVIDTVRSDKEVTATQRWQLGHEVAAQQGRGGIEMSSGSQKALMHFSGTPGDIAVHRGGADVAEGWVALGWKTKSEAPVVTVTKSGTAFRFIAVIAAGAGTYPTVVRARNLPKGHIGFNVDTGRISEQIVLGPEEVHFVEYGADAHRLKRLGDNPPLLRSDAHFDPGKRSGAFQLVTETRSKAWLADNPTEFEAIGEEFRRDAESLGLAEAQDLGIRACSADLAMISHSTTVQSNAVRKLRAGLINWSAQDDYQPTFPPMPLVSYRGMPDKVQVDHNATVFSFDLGALVLPAAFAPGAGRTLTVLFQGAVDRARTRLPIFQRLRFQSQMNVGPTLVVADPTLDLSTELRLGWYLGTEDLDLVPLVAELVRVVGKSCGAERYVLQGGSGGGFAALQVSAFLPGSHVVAVNPQTDLRNYVPRLSTIAYQSVFGQNSAPETQEDIPRLSVTDRFVQKSALPRITLVSNPGDKFHVDRHAVPFERELFRLGMADHYERVNLDLGPGHRSLDNVRYAEIMMGVYQKN